MKNKISVIELFTGLGAGTQALINLFGKQNVVVVDSIEKDKHAVKSYNAINETNFVPKDINDVDMSSYPEVDVMIAGWPCQDYSVAGKGLGLEGTRSNLILMTISKIKEMVNKPKHILLENVKGLISKRHTEDLEYIKKCFNQLGYNWDQAVLNSKYFGVPQSRERVFMLLTRKDCGFKTINSLEYRHVVEKTLKDILDFNVETQTVEIKPIPGQQYEYALNEMKQYNGKFIQINIEKLINQKEDQINWVALLGNLDVNEKFDKTAIYEQNGRFNGVDGIGSTLRGAPDAGFQNKIMFTRIPFKQDCAFQGINGQSHTLVVENSDFKNKIAYGNSAQIHYRKLTSLECWRLMGFSDEAHNKCVEAGVSNAQLVKQAGNSIVVNVLESIFYRVFMERIMNG